MSSITQSSESLTLAGAKIAVAAAEAKAREMGLGMNIAVVDASVRTRPSIPPSLLNPSSDSISWLSFFHLHDLFASRFPAPDNMQTHLLHFSRMPGAKITSITIAMDKAFTAAGHRQGTHLYREAVWPGGPAFGHVSTFPALSLSASTVC
jgi:uncharacterized protein GlcG (DUF336 family)